MKEQYVSDIEKYLSDPTVVLKRREFVLYSYGSPYEGPISAEELIEARRFHKHGLTQPRPDRGETKAPAGLTAQDRG